MWLYIELLLTYEHISPGKPLIQRTGCRSASGNGNAIQLGKLDCLKVFEPSLNNLALLLAALFQHLLQFDVHYKT